MHKRTYTREFNCETMRLTIATNVHIPAFPHSVFMGVFRTAGKSYTTSRGEVFEFLSNSESAFERAENILRGGLFEVADS